MSPNPPRAGPVLVIVAAGLVAAVLVAVALAARQPSPIYTASENVLVTSLARPDPAHGADWDHENTKQPAGSTISTDTQALVNAVSRCRRSSPRRSRNCASRSSARSGHAHRHRARLVDEHLRRLHFKQFATGLTDEVCQGAERLAQSLKRPFTYLSSSTLSKEELARQIAERDGIKEGLVAIFRCVEPCRTYKMRGNYQTKKLEPHLEFGQVPAPVLLCPAPTPWIDAP